MQVVGIIYYAYPHPTVISTHGTGSGGNAEFSASSSLGSRPGRIFCWLDSAVFWLDAGQVATQTNRHRAQLHVGMIPASPPGAGSDDTVI